ncbi:hypothetical protein OS493_028170 [Desmophyllum pertusum]|uniref:Uncharacterized protein n=1 Tax=Desmophyllum pertusum TaxID=174260 RepID=A0A9X0CW00_9CNID|nr:hypothetical protein OS493_028170 [Desmophyllum pertusum]
MADLRAKVVGCARRKHCAVGVANGVSCKNGSRTPNVSMHKFSSAVSTRNQLMRFVRSFIGKARQFTLQLSQCAINSTIKWNYTIRFLQGDSDVTERLCTYQRFNVCSWRSRIKRIRRERRQTPDLDWGSQLLDCSLSSTATSPKYCFYRQLV